MVEDAGLHIATSSVCSQNWHLKVYQKVVKTRLTKSRNLSWSIVVILENWSSLLTKSLSLTYYYRNICVQGSDAKWYHYLAIGSFYVVEKCGRIFVDNIFIFNISLQYISYVFYEKMRHKETPSLCIFAWI